MINLIKDDDNYNQRTQLKKCENSVISRSHVFLVIFFQSSNIIFLKEITDFIWLTGKIRATQHSFRKELSQVNFHRNFLLLHVTNDYSKIPLMRQNGGLSSEMVLIVERFSLIF